MLWKLSNHKDFISLSSCDRSYIRRYKQGVSIWSDLTRRSHGYFPVWTFILDCYLSAFYERAIFSNLKLNQANRSTNLEPTGQSSIVRTLYAKRRSWVFICALGQGISKILGRKGDLWIELCCRMLSNCLTPICIITRIGSIIWMQKVQIDYLFLFSKGLILRTMALGLVRFRRGEAMCRFIV